MLAKNAGFVERSKRSLSFVTLSISGNAVLSVKNVKREKDRRKGDLLKGM
jgi:hypothetical protein